MAYNIGKIHFFGKKLCFVIFFCTFAAFFIERLGNGNRKHTFLLCTKDKKNPSDDNVYCRLSDADSIGDAKY